MVKHGRCSDLIVVGQTGRGLLADGVAFDFPQQVLLPAMPDRRSWSFRTLARSRRSVTPSWSPGRKRRRRPTRCAARCRCCA